MTVVYKEKIQYIHSLHQDLWTRCFICRWQFEYYAFPTHTIRPHFSIPCFLPLMTKTRQVSVNLIQTSALEARVVFSLPGCSPRPSYATRFIPLPDWARLIKIFCCTLHHKVWIRVKLSQLGVRPQSPLHVQRLDQNFSPCLIFKYYDFFFVIK